MGQLAVFTIIIGGLLFVFAAFALFITPVMICPPLMHNPTTQLGDPIVELCAYVNHK